MIFPSDVPLHPLKDETWGMDPDALEARLKELKMR